mmetsp:Transcript_88114/g.247803  ORF Transcript_88114/g.247803 Transcript_88114/m.247803 type:complete len:269 (-) Transcript_88114:637-1443(-)
MDSGLGATSKGAAAVPTAPPPLWAAWTRPTVARPGSGKAPATTSRRAPAASPVPGSWSVSARACCSAEQEADDSHESPAKIAQCRRRCSPLANTRQRYQILASLRLQSNPPRPARPRPSTFDRGGNFGRSRPSRGIRLLRRQRNRRPSSAFSWKNTCLRPMVLTATHARTSSRHAHARGSHWAHLGRSIRSRGVRRPRSQRNRRPSSAFSWKKICLRLVVLTAPRARTFSRCARAYGSHRVHLPSQAPPQLVRPSIAALIQALSCSNP